MRGHHREKLDSYPVEWLLRIVREWVFRVNLSARMHIQKILENASRRQSAEATWLLSVLTKNNSESLPAVARLDWVRECLSSSATDNPWFDYYYGRAFDDAERIKQSALSGYPPAIFVIAGRVWKDDGSGFLCRLKKASALGDADATYHLALRTSFDESVQYYHTAAQQGHPTAMEYFSASSGALFGRAIALSGHCNFSYGAREREAMRYDFQYRFELGRELFGVDEFSTMAAELPLEILQSIEFYTDVTRNARSASLSTILVLHDGCGVARDVARMIGKMVYDTRNVEAGLWQTLCFCTQEKKDPLAKIRRLIS